MSIKLDPASFVDLILEFEQNHNVEELEQKFYHFISSLGIEAKLFHTATNIRLTLSSEHTALSLIWLPRDSHYCPQLAGRCNDELTGISAEVYLCIWRAFNAFSHAVWQLPKRYQHILEGLCQGKNLQQIAVEMNLSLPSVKRYMRLIRELLDAKTNPHAIAIALRHGWI